MLVVIYFFSFFSRASPAPRIHALKRRQRRLLDNLHRINRLPPHEEQCLAGRSPSGFVLPLLPQGRRERRNLLPLLAATDPTLSPLMSGGPALPASLELYLR